MKIETVYNDDHTTVFTRGHVNLEDFIKACEEYNDGPLDQGREDPSHEIWRCVPDSTGEFHCLYIPAKREGKGAFKVTAMIT